MSTFLQSKSKHFINYSPFAWQQRVKDEWNGCGVQLVAMKMYSFSRPDCCKLISVFRYTVWALLKKAAAHCRSCRCFQAGLKWNSLLLFITRCSIMNVRKVERAAVIYFQGIRGDAAVLWESADPAVISGMLRENPVPSHNKCLHFQSMQIITTALSYWFNSTQNIFMKY